MAGTVADAMRPILIARTKNPEESPNLVRLHHPVLGRSSADRIPRPPANPTRDRDPAAVKIVPALAKHHTAALYSVGAGEKSYAGDPELRDGPPHPPPEVLR